MTVHDAPPPAPEAAELLRQRLSRGPGCRAAAAEPRELEVGARRFRLWPLASRPPCVALLCEPLGGVSLPAYAARRRIRAGVAPRRDPCLVVFTDAAHAREIWSWRSRGPGGLVAWHELARPPGLPWSDWLRLMRSVAGPLAGPGAPPAADPAAEAGAAAALAAVLRRSRGPAPRWRRGAAPASAAVLGQRVQDAIEAARRPDEIRAWWRALTGLTALDPACGRGAWLLGVLDALEPAYDACLDRMQGWVDESDRAPRGARRGRLRDFRAVLERASDRGVFPTRRHFARECIVLRTLFGADRDADSVREAELRLRLRLGAGEADGDGDHPGAVLPIHLLRGDPAVGLATPSEVRDALGALGRPDLVEEVEALDRAERAAFDLRLLHGAPAPELAAARAEVQRRRAAVASRLDGVLAHRSGVDPADPGGVRRWRIEHRPVHRGLEYLGVLRRGGFAVERGREP